MKKVPRFNSVYSGFVAPLLILGIIFAAAVGFGIYYKTQNLNNKPVSEALFTKQSPSPSASNYDYSTTCSDQSLTLQTGTYYRIKELGVQMRLKESIKNLMYSVCKYNNLPDPYWVDISFTSKELIEIGETDKGKRQGNENYCSAKDSPLGGMSIVTKAESKEEENKGTWRDFEILTSRSKGEDAIYTLPLVKDLGDFFVSYTTPQAVCSESDSGELQTKQRDLLIESFQTMEKIK